MAKQLEVSAKSAKNEAAKRTHKIASLETRHNLASTANTELLRSLADLEQSSGGRAATKLLLKKAAEQLAESAEVIETTDAVAEREQATLSKGSSALAGKAARLSQLAAGLTGANGLVCKVGEGEAMLTGLHTEAQSAVNNSSAELAGLMARIATLTEDAKGAAKVDKALVSAQREGVAKLDDETNRLDAECAKVGSTATAACKRRREAIEKIAGSKTAVESATVDGLKRVSDEQGVLSSEAAAAAAAIAGADGAEASVAATSKGNEDVKARHESERGEFAPALIRLIAQRTLRLTQHFLTCALALFCLPTFLSPTARLSSASSDCASAEILHSAATKRELDASSEHDTAAARREHLVGMGKCCL